MVVFTSYDYEPLGGGKRSFRKRTCRSKSRCGGAAAYVMSGKQVPAFGGGGLRGVRGVRRSRRGGRGYRDYLL